MNRNGSGFLIFFLLMIFMPGFFIGPIFSLLFSAIPMIFVGAVLISAFKKKDTQEPAYVKTNSKRQTKNISNRDLNRIDKKLESYFKNNYKLPIFENIALTTQNGTYTALEQLYISMDDEMILPLEEFKGNYPDMYNRIVELLIAFTKQDEKVMQAEVKQPEIKKEDMLSDAQKYIDRINALNIEIPNEEITNGLYQATALLKQIDLVEKDDKDEKIGKLYDYYLPILINILENYKSLAKAGMQNQEFKENEVQLIKTIILINEALKTINTTLHEEEYMNLQADITTLQSLLHKDGLVSSPFDKEDTHGKE